MRSPRGVRALSALVAVGTFLGASASAAADSPGPSLELVWVDLAGLGPPLVAGTCAAAEQLVAPVGLRLSSRCAPAGSGFVPGHAVVILMERNPNPGHSGRPVAGAVQAGAGRLPAVWVFPRVVAHGLGLDPAHARGWTSWQRVDFARALAAVVLHELAHLMCDAEHAAGGLMAQALDCRHRGCRGVAPDETLASCLREAARRATAARGR